MRGSSDPDERSYLALVGAVDLKSQNRVVSVLSPADLTADKRDGYFFGSYSSTSLTMRSTYLRTA